MISILISVYASEKAPFFKDAMESLVIAAPSNAEIVLVQDGPLPSDLNEVIESFRGRLQIKDVILPVNVGLGPALNAGLAQCSYPLVGRFDSDDLCTPDRFRLQIARFENDQELDVLSGWMNEFDKRPEVSHAIRKLPIEHEEIVKFARKRNPFNHPAVMFKKEKVVAAGGYQKDYLFEDYALWVRMIQCGCKTANLPHVIVFARTGPNMYRRRGGWRYAKSEIKILNSFRKSGFVTSMGFILSITCRIPVRLLPGFFRGKLYEILLRKGMSKE